MSEVAAPLGAPELLATHKALAARLAEALARPDGAGAALEAHRSACALVEERLLPRLGGLERVRAAVDRLEDVGAATELLERAPREAAAAVELDRVLLSRVHDGTLVAEVLYWREDATAAAATLARLQAAPVRLDYPLIEGELLRRRRALLVGGDEPRGRQANAEIMAWEAYVTAPIVLEGRVIGFLHGDRRAGGAPLGWLERDALAGFAHGFALVFERAVLRRRLRVQRQEMRRVASWADARTSELSDRAVDLAGDREEDGEGAAARTHADIAGGAAVRDLLTRRELEVLELMVRGETNASIARELVISPGTAKFHVKNILRKLHAANRAEAISRYLRLTLRRAEPTGASPWP